MKETGSGVFILWGAGGGGADGHGQSTGCSFFLMEMKITMLHHGNFQGHLRKSGFQRTIEQPCRNSKQLRLDA